MLNEWLKWPEWPEWPTWMTRWPKWLDDRKLRRRMTVWYIYCTWKLWSVNIYTRYPMNSVTIKPLFIVCEIGHFRIARILFTTLFSESTFIIQQPSQHQAVMPRYRPPSRDRDSRSTRTGLKQPQYTVQDLPPPSKYHLYNI